MVSEGVQPGSPSPVRIPPAGMEPGRCGMEPGRCGMEPGRSGTKPRVPALPGTCQNWAHLEVMPVKGMFSRLEIK